RRLRLPTLESKYLVLRSSVNTAACSCAGLRYGLLFGSGTSVCRSTHILTDESYAGGWMTTQPIEPAITSATGPSRDRPGPKEGRQQPKHRRQCRPGTCVRGMGTGEDVLYLSRLAVGCRPGRTGRAWDRCRVGPFHADAGLTRVGSGVIAPAEPMARTPPTHT